MSQVGESRVIYVAELCYAGVYFFHVEIYFSISYIYQLKLTL